jgi:hypothetical protein
VSSQNAARKLAAVMNRQALPSSQARQRIGRNGEVHSTIDFSGEAAGYAFG